MDKIKITFVFVVFCALILNCVSVKDVESKKETNTLKEEIIIENLED